MKFYKKIVIKIGSAVISSDEGVNISVLENIASNVVSLIKNNSAKIIIVSSGAVSSGMYLLKRKQKPVLLPEKQAIAAIGQIFLVNKYREAFEKHGFRTGQMLLTNDVLTNRDWFVNAKNTLQVLLDWGVIPIINENDSISIEELRFGDNDRLAALVSILVDADLLLILSDVEGLYTGHPKEEGSRKLDVVEKVDKRIYGYASHSASKLGTGGMRSKIKAAEIVTKSGIDCKICNGLTQDAILKALSEDNFGTFFKAQSGINARRRWLAFSSRSKGSIVLDDGAVRAVLEKGKSILPIGIKKVRGNFSANDVVDVLTETGELIARGIVFYSAEDLRKIIGKKSAEIARLLEGSIYEEAIHRDNLVILKEV